MSYNLYLDDIRNPTGSDWVILRDYYSAIEYVTTHGFPSKISFDHDLGENVPTGMDFAKWLVEYDLDHGDMPEDFMFNVHSANPPGAANINGLMRHYLRAREYD